MTDIAKTAIDMFCNMLCQVNISEIDEDDPHYVLYAIRLPAESRLDHDDLVALGHDRLDAQRQRQQTDDQHDQLRLEVQRGKV